MTAYEMRSSDWSSDVCSSDLVLQVGKDDQIAAARQTTCHVVELGPDAWGVHVKQDDRPRAFTVLTGYEHDVLSVGKRQNLLLAYACMHRAPCHFSPPISTWPIANSNPVFVSKND